MKNCCILLFACLLLGCSKRAPTPPPPSSEDVYAVQDSIRRSLLLRISLAQMEISRQAEMMRRRAYHADRKLAEQLKLKITAAERAAVALGSQSTLLLNDSLPSDWLDIQQRTDLIIEEVSRTLQTVF